MHDATKVVLGSTQSSEKLASCEDGDPATFLAGLAVKRASTGLLSLSSGQRIGISMGKSLSDHRKTSVMRNGNRVPLRLTNNGATATLVKADLTFTAKANGLAGNSITIAFLDTGTAGAEVVTVVGNAISVSMEDGVSTATQMKAALDGNAAALALITTTISGTAGDAQDAFAITPLASGTDSYAFAAPGVAVQVSATTGKAIASGDATSMIYLTGLMYGVESDLSEVPVALVDMGGGA